MRRCHGDESCWAAMGGGGHALDLRIRIRERGHITALDHRG
jgi:hypothetical protein